MYSSFTFYIRDWEGNVVVIEIRRLEDGPSLVAEAKAFRIGVEFFLNNQYVPLILEVDSLVWKKVLDGMGGSMGYNNGSKED